MSWKFYFLKWPPLEHPPPSAPIPATLLFCVPAIQRLQKAPVTTTRPLELSLDRLFSGTEVIFPLLCSLDSWTV